MPLTPNQCWKLVKLAQMECNLAKQTARDRYGYSVTNHVVWHCLKPWLGERHLPELVYNIEFVLLPECKRLPNWQSLVPELELLILKLSELLPAEFTPSCSQCSQGERLS